MTTTQSNKIKDGISNFLTPILITVIGYFILQAFNGITEDLNELKQYNVDRDEWVLLWVEKNQGVIDWARREMYKNNK